MMPDVLRRVEDPVGQRSVELHQFDQPGRRHIAESGQRPEQLVHLDQLRDARFGQPETRLALQVDRAGQSLVQGVQLTADDPPHLVLVIGIRRGRRRGARLPLHRQRGECVTPGAILRVDRAGVVAAQVDGDATVVATGHGRIELCFLEHHYLRGIRTGRAVTSLGRAARLDRSPGGRAGLVWPISQIGTPLEERVPIRRSDCERGHGPGILIMSTNFPTLEESEPDTVVCVLFPRGRSRRRRFRHHHVHRSPRLGGGGLRVAGRSAPSGTPVPDRLRCRCLAHSLAGLLRSQYRLDRPRHPRRVRQPVGAERHLLLLLDADPGPDAARPPAQLVVAAAARAGPRRRSTVALDLLAGPVAFAIAALLPALLAQVAQLHALFIKPNIGGVSLPYMAMNVLNQLIWVTWAAFAGESSVIMVGSTLGVLMVANLTLGPAPPLQGGTRQAGPAARVSGRARSEDGGPGRQRSVPGLQLLLDLAVQPGDPTPQLFQVAGPPHLPLGVGEDPVRGSGQYAQVARSRRAAPRSSCAASAPERSSPDTRCRRSGRGC